jgi:hypothetical protein
LSGNVNPLFTLILRLSAQRKSPAFRQGLSSISASPELTVWILLLAGLLLPATLLSAAPAALLLLTWLLPGGLVLLARILVGIAHSGLPC